MSEKVVHKFERYFKDTALFFVVCIGKVVKYGEIKSSDDWQFVTCKKCLACKKESK